MARKSSSTAAQKKPTKSHKPAKGGKPARGGGAGQQRPIWTGMVSFGLVTLPVRMFSAVTQKEVHFHQLHDADGSRIRQERICAADGEPVPYNHIVKGYEVSPGKYVEVTPEELAAFDPAATKTIDIEDFVDIHDIDPIYYESTYYLAPDRDAAKPYALLHAALTRRSRVGIARMVMHNKQHLCVVRPLGPVLSVSTLQYADEIRPAEALPGLPRDQSKPRERELAMAEQLIESLSTQFRPERYHDEYREKILAFLKKKAEGGEVVASSEPPRALPASELMRALQESLNAVRSKKGGKSGGTDSHQAANDTRNKAASAKRPAKSAGAKTATRSRKAARPKAA